MPPPTNPIILTCFRTILADWAYTGTVTIKEADGAERWAQKKLPNFAVKHLAKLMHDHVQAGGVIDQKPEKRPEYTDRDFHYDFRLAWVGRAIYVETILVDDDPKNPYIHIVSVHDV